MSLTEIKLRLNLKTHEFVKDNVTYVISSKATLQLSCTLSKNCTYPTKTCKITKNGTVCASLLPPTTVAIYTQVMLH